MRSTVTTILFPIFASYKALRTSDPAQLSPWLMYWTVLSLLLITESIFGFILSWVPFYSWIRLFVHLYLVMPGIQAPKMIYWTYLEPFLREHEQEIERYITEAHDNAKKMGLGYANVLIEWARVNVLGQQPKPPTPPRSRNVSYAEQLLGRFNMPTAQTGSGGDMYTMLSSALQGLSGGGSREAQAEELSASGHLIPDTIRGEHERRSYVQTQRERLQVLLQAYDQEEHHMTGGGSRARPSQGRNISGDSRGDTRLPKSRSELEFDNIDPDEVDDRRESGSWIPFGWGGQAGKATGAAHMPDPDEYRRRSGARRDDDDDYRRRSGGRRDDRHSSGFEM